MIKKRYKNEDIQKWYEKVVRVKMTSDKEYMGLTEEAADEKCHNLNKGTIKHESTNIHKHLFE